MPEDRARIAERIQGLLSPGVRGNLIPKGLARSIIWREGKLPPASPNYSSTLSGDLLEYGYTLLRLALLLREAGGAGEIARNGFERAAEAIESVVRNGDAADPERGFHTVVAACAYHLAHFSARSFSLVPSPENLNLAPPELALAYLLRRSLSAIRAQCDQWLDAREHSDDNLSERLANEADDFCVDELLADGVSENLLRALAVFDFGLLTGDDASAETAVSILAECQTAASDFNLVTLWWVSKLAKNLISDLWGQSLYQQLSPELSGPERDSWTAVRKTFIAWLQARQVAEIELWPSQVEAARRALDEKDDLVISLPTSAGKTRVAELCILRAFTSGKRVVVYVTPLRALSAQVERDLKEIFRPLGKSVSSLYGASGEVGLDSDTLANRDIVVATPEKLDFALRQDASLLDDVGLIVLDEAHTIGPREREVRYEVLVQRLLRRQDASNRRIVCLSAILPKGEQIDDFVSWIRQGEPNQERRSLPIGVQRGNALARSAGSVIMPDSIWTSKTKPRSFPALSRGCCRRRLRRRCFPQNSAQLTLAAAWRIAKEGRSALIFCPQRNSVESLANAVLELHAKGLLERLVSATPELDRAKRVGIKWLGAHHPAVSCLDIGVAVHHAGLPKAFLREIEALLRARRVSVIISSPTLAQGVNLSASTLLMYSLHRGKEIIPGEDFGNVVGRAGRARVDIDGQILNVLYDPAPWRLKEWELLKKRARERQIQSGLVALIGLILNRLKSTYDLDSDLLLEYVANNTDVWDTVFGNDSEADDGPPPTELLASLDTAILALVERLDCNVADLPALLDEILTDSLWARTLARHDRSQKAVQLRLLECRAGLIWSSSSALQRKGYFAAGVGFDSGRRMDNC